MQGRLQQPPPPPPRRQGALQTQKPRPLKWLRAQKHEHHENQLQEAFGIIPGWTLFVRPPPTEGAGAHADAGIPSCVVGRRVVRMHPRERI